MAAINPKQLLESAMAAGGSGGAPQDSVQVPGAAGAAAGTIAGPQGGLQDVLPQELAGAQPVGAENSGVLSTSDLQNQMGVGSQALDATGRAVQQMIAVEQDPKTPPQEKAVISQQLQLAALRALTARGPAGAVGAPQS